MGGDGLWCRVRGGAHFQVLTLHLLDLDDEHLLAGSLQTCL